MVSAFISLLPSLSSPLTGPLHGRAGSGEWVTENKIGTHWAFLVGDFTRFAYLYCIWLLFKKIALTSSMEHSDGALNASIALVLQVE